MEDDSAPDQWQNVSFGESNDAEGDPLFQQIGRVDVRDNVKSSGGEYTVGVPKIFAEDDFDALEMWETAEVAATIPSEAEGRNIGVKFTHSGKGWGYVDTVKLEIESKDWIENGNFDLPVAREDGRWINFSQVPGWEDMADPSPASGVITDDNGRVVAATHTRRSAFGQITAVEGKEGQTVTLTFDFRATGASRIIAELYYIGE